MLAITSGGRRGWRYPGFRYFDAGMDWLSIVPLL